MDKHWYGILPNGAAYMVNWFTRVKNGDICMVPASSDKYRFGAEEQLETASAKAVDIAKKDYDVVLYKRMAENPSQDGYYHFQPERYLVNNKNILGDLKGGDNND